MVFGLYSHKCWRYHIHNRISNQSQLWLYRELISTKGIFMVHKTKSFCTIAPFLMSSHFFVCLILFSSVKPTAFIRVPLNPKHAAEKKQFCEIRHHRTGTRNRKSWQIRRRTGTLIQKSFHHCELRVHCETFSSTSLKHHIGNEFFEVPIISSDTVNL